MKLFIANTTKHIQQFGYRIPEFARLFEQRIGIGEQIVIYQDASKEILEGILAQHTDSPKPFCISADEALRHKGFVGLIYSFDKPVSATAIEGTFETNDSALIEQSAEQRKEAAAAHSQQIEQNAEEIGSGIKAVEMSIVEESAKGSQESDAQINETIQVAVKGKKK